DLCQGGTLDGMPRLQAADLRARFLRGTGPITLPAFRRSSKLVGRPVLIVELECNDLDRAVPRHRAQPYRAVVLAPHNRAHERIQIRRGLTVDLHDASSRPELISRGWRTVRKVGDEDARRLDPALRRERTVRRLQHCPGPHDDAIELGAAERDGGHFDRLLLTIAQYHDLDGRLLHGALHFAESIHDLAVDRKNDIPGTQEPIRRRAAHEAGYAQHLPTVGAVLGDARYPLGRQPQLACRIKRYRREFRLERIQQTTLTHDLQHLDDELSGNAAVLLGDVASGLVREAGPRGDDVAILAHDHAIVVGRTVHETDCLEVCLTEPQRARQRI